MNPQFPWKDAPSSELSASKFIGSNWHGMCLYLVVGLAHYKE